MKNFKPSWTQVALGALVLAAWLASYYMPETARAEMRADLGYVWAVAASFLPALVSKKAPEVDA